MVKKNKRICPKCGSIVDEENEMRCSRFPVCTYQLVTDKELSSYIMYDLETTGLSRQDHIIEIGAIYVKDDMIIDSFSELCNPGVLISQRITEVTNITNDMLKDKRTEEEVIRDFIRWVEDKETDICVGHNINRFDNKVLDFATKRYHSNFPFQRTLDTMVMGQKAALKESGKVNSLKQVELAKYYGFTYEAHRAVNDVEALFRIFNHLKDELEELPILPIM